MNYTIIPEKTARDHFRQSRGIYQYHYNKHYYVMKSKGIDIEAEPTKEYKCQILKKLGVL